MGTQFVIQSKSTNLNISSIDVDNKTFGMILDVDKAKRYRTKSMADRMIESIKSLAIASVFEFEAVPVLIE